MPPCSPPSRTLRAASRWPAAILDRGCARRPENVRPGRGNGILPNKETPPEMVDFCAAIWPVFPPPLTESGVRGACRSPVGHSAGNLWGTQTMRSGEVSGDDMRQLSAGLQEIPVTYWANGHKKRRQKTVSLLLLTNRSQVRALVRPPIQGVITLCAAIEGTSLAAALPFVTALAHRGRGRRHRPGSTVRPFARRQGSRQWCAITNAACDGSCVRSSSKRRARPSTTQRVPRHRPPPSFGMYLPMPHRGLISARSGSA